jgi:hypothetical protein
LVSLTSIFFGYATYNNIYGAVLFAEKALVVGRIQIAFDPNFFPLTDKSSDNLRYKFLHALFGRGSDAIDADTLIRPKPLKADLGENVNAQIVESKRGSSKPVDAFHNMKTVTWRKRVARNSCHVDLLGIFQRSTDEG